MCIRDRAYSEAEAQKQAEERARIMEEARREAENTLHSAAGEAVPVSYTHLDVYKRQAVSLSGGTTSPSDAYDSAEANGAHGARGEKPCRVRPEKTRRAGAGPAADERKSVWVSHM